MIFYFTLTCVATILISTKYLLLNEETFILVSFILFLIYSFKFVAPLITKNIDFEIDTIKNSLTKNFSITKSQTLAIASKVMKLPIKSQIFAFNAVLIKLIKETLNYKVYYLFIEQRNADINKLILLNNIEKNLSKLIKLYFYTELIIFVSLVNSIMYNKFFKNYFIKKQLVECQELINKI
uniref:ATP synthase subunit 4 n=1 Tax=Compsopogon caeruleus TaxID=31354 RepID=A0A1Z1XBJ2_9RHOD|nr:ATP synthase subunit 4 [Compsopogon caeruleus]ARX96195.1 ATP synthase subunit 4 [Compsopogon caeruleus]